MLALVLAPGGAWASLDPTETSSTSSAAESLSSLSLDEPAPSEEESFTFGRPPTVIEAIEVIGNAKTEREVILRRILVSVGDLLDDDRIEESRLRLLGSGYFKEVEFSLRRGSRRGRVVVVIEVVERNTVLIDRLFIGFSDVSPFFGGLGIHESNFFGTGVGAGAAFVAGKDRRAFDFQVFLPDLSGTPLQLEAQAIFVEGRETLSEDDPTGLQLRYSRAGGTLGVGLGVGPSQRVVLDYRLESVHADRLPSLDPALLRRAPSIQFDESILSTLSLTYERDTRDDPFVATRGTRVALSVEAGTRLVGSSYEFSKYTADFQAAFNPFRDHSLSLRLFGGVVQGQTPFFNQFFLNDYAYFALGRRSLPRAIQVNFSESNDYDDLVISVGADYSVPLLEGDEWLYRLYVYGGVDVSATASLDELQEDPKGRGTGGYVPLSVDAGIRLDTWIGNFTLSVAYVFDLVF